MDRIIIDSGNLHNNARLLKSDGTVKSINFPSWRATVTGHTVSLPGGQEVMDYVWSEWGGQKWVWGDIAMTLNATPEMQLGEYRVAGDLHQHAICYAAAMMGVKSGEVGLTLFLPPGLYNDLRDWTIAQFEGQEAEILIKGDKKPRRWTWKDVQVYAEGAAAVGCLLLNSDGSRAENLDMAKGRLYVGDGGGHTFDSIEVVNGQIMADQFNYSSAQGFGLFNHVIKPLAQMWAAKLSYITPGHVDSAIRNWLAGDRCILDPDNMAIDIQTSVEALATDYAGKILSRWDTMYDGLKPYRHGLLVGGYAHPKLCGRILTEKINGTGKTKGDKIIDPKLLPQLKGIEAVNMNVEAALRMALAKNQGSKRRKAG